MRSCDIFHFSLHLLVEEGDVLFTHDVVIFRAALSLVCMFSVSASEVFSCVCVSILKEFFLMLLLFGGFGPYESDVD